MINRLLLPLAIWLIGLVSVASQNDTGTSVQIGLVEVVENATVVMNDGNETYAPTDHSNIFEHDDEDENQQAGEGLCYITYQMSDNDLHA